MVKEKDISLTAINVSYTDRIEEREIRALEEFSGVEGFGGQVKELLLLTKDTEKKENGVRYMPLWKWVLKTW